MSDRDLGSLEDREHVFYKFIFEKKTLFWTFLFWFGLRSFAGHFIYLERYVEAFTYFLVITICVSIPLALFGEAIGIAVLGLFRIGELIYLPILVKNSNKVHEQNLREEFGLERMS